MNTSGRGGRPVCRRTMLKAALASAAGGLLLPELRAAPPAADRPKKGALWVGEIKFRSKFTQDKGHRQPAYFEEWHVKLKVALREERQSADFCYLKLERLEFEARVSVPELQEDRSFLNGKVGTFKYSPIPTVTGTLFANRVVTSGKERCGWIRHLGAGKGTQYYFSPTDPVDGFEGALKAALGSKWKDHLRGQYVWTHPEFGPEEREYSVLPPLAPVIGAANPSVCHADDSKRFLDEQGVRVEGSFKRWRTSDIGHTECDSSWDLKRAARPVMVYADAFIPTARVRFPVPPLEVPPQSSATLNGVVRESKGYHELEGDDREFVKGGAFRLRTIVVVDLAADQPLLQSTHHVGVSRGFYYKLVRDPSVPEGVDGAYVRAEFADAATAGDGGMKETVSKEDGRVVVKIDASAALPLFKLAPAIDYHYTLKLWATGSEVVYGIDGHTDGFPAYSLYIEDELVHKHDPRTGDETPFSMIGTGRQEQRVTKIGRIPLPE